MSKFSIGTRLLAGFSFVLILLAVIIATGVNSLNKSEDQLKNVKRISGLSNKVVVATIADKDIQELVKGLIMVDLSAERGRVVASIRELEQKCAEAVDVLDKNTKTPDGKKLVAEVKAAREEVARVDEKLITLAISGDSAGFKAMMNVEGEKAIARSSSALDALLSFYDKRVGVRVDDAIDNAAYATRLMFGLGIAAILLGILAAVFITRSITVPLHTCVEMADKIADGDMSISMRVEDGKCETVHLIKAIANMAERIRDAIGRVSLAAGEVSAAVTELHENSQRMVRGTDEVSSQASMVATAGEEMAATSLDIANNCNSAAESSRHANQLATSGASIVQGTVDGMARIAERVRATARSVENLGSRSDEIGAIVGTIEDIADQTNLLALNAAIEAARAGEQGRGFAVVADEVRALAERTTRATKEIGGMIKAIQTETHQAVLSMDEGVNEVERGTQEASKSGSALEEILAQINEVTNQINQIATAAEEQSSTSRDISNNMHMITGIVNETAQGTQATAKAADQLTALANDLKVLVAQFRL
ncbi:methyl-accepting chemotaxis protein [Pelobacter propionicus]|uniref:Methyl-accepting chemotaxis sensory transducer n=1 Tax=Pelobacter propionicus (strain DSM 2379 / NBRC 103807 / OttBd1) TaxID=338966 RepID=A1ALY5_PELPD|nr:HAMP domain-containing methyl-accepting chemotaxis protein [Pelobacter propionicus]ABK98355.1 methyl-accepting chemotaxis sensory transducer [Pelobacter propionicus DSM 2379]